MTTSIHSSSRLRSDVIEHARRGPIAILTSQADGRTTNVLGMSDLFRSLVTKNVIMFVTTHNGNIEFSASEYLTAFDIYNNGTDIPTELDHVVEYIHTPVVEIPTLIS